jgi:predicted nucleic acid-binding protein
LSAIYLDSSAFVKLTVEEPETGALRTYIAEQNDRRVSSALLRTEALRASRHLGSDVLVTVREGLRRIDLVAIDDRILDTAGTLEPRVLRTLDAIHLATALAVGDDLEALVTYDERMAEGARLLGLQAVAPR